MKNLLFRLLLFGFLFAAAPVAQAQKYLDINVANDTLSNQVTKNYTTTPALIDVPYYYSIHVAADSISGANAGTVRLQVSNDRLGTTWYTVQTMTVDGTGTDEALWEGLLYARRFRVQYEMPSGTRKVRARVYASLKRVY